MTYIRELPVTHESKADKELHCSHSTEGYTCEIITTMEDGLVKREPQANDKKVFDEIEQEFLDKLHL